MEKEKIVEAADDFVLDVVSVRLVKDAPIYSERPLSNPSEAVAVLGDVMCQFDREVVAVLNLRSDLKPINVTFVSMGALNEAMIHPREVMKASILSNAARIMLIHSHPSGNLMPSKEDTKVTDRMNSVCELLGIPLVDHIIVGGDNTQYFSFKEKGFLDTPTIALNTDYHNISLTPALVADGRKAR